MANSSSDEKYKQRNKNTLPAGCKISLKICVQFNKYKRKMFALECPLRHFSICLKVLSSITKTSKQQDKRLHLTLKCHLDDFLTPLVDLHMLNRRTKKSIAALINLQ